jgi:ankyrin repeat protein
MSKAAAAVNEQPKLYSSAHRLAAHGGVQLKELRSLPVDTTQKPDDVGMHALCWAARTGDLATVKYLIEEAGNSDISSVVGWGGVTPLMFASVGAFETVVTELLAHKADVMAADDGGNTALFYAAKGGSISLFQSLMEVGGEALVNAKNALGRTALFVAAAHGQQAIVSALLKTNASVFEVDCRGNNVLHVAASCGFARIVEQLLQAAAGKAEALTTAKNDEGLTPAEAASTSAAKSACTGRPSSAAAGK